MKNGRNYFSILNFQFLIEKAMRLQLIVATLLVLSGLVLLFSGFWVDPTGEIDGSVLVVDPTGEIDGSVLVAFGEMCTFAGALFGVDYSYKLRNKN